MIGTVITLVFIFGSVVATSVVLFLVLRRREFAKKYALFIVSFAALATIASLLYTRTTVEESTEAQLIALTTGVSSFERCGPVDPASTKCYERVDQYGYPFPIATTNYKDTENGPTTDTYFARRRAVGLVGNYIVYLGIASLLAAAYAGIDALAKHASRRVK